MLQVYKKRLKNRAFPSKDIEIHMSQPFIPYGHQCIDEDDIAAVVSVLRGDWLTTGPAVEQFEQDICHFTGAKYAIAVTNGTAALHAAMNAIGITHGDEVIVSPMTFAATANAVLYCGGKPIFADVDANTLLINPAAVENAISSRTKAIIGVDYAGQPCDWEALRNIATRHGLSLVADACHSLGGSYKGHKVGTLADISCLSFHPVKNMTTGEGGMALTNDAPLAQKIHHFRGHGITTTAKQRQTVGTWFYEMQNLGFNYRITDFQCALGSSQLKKLSTWIEKRNILAREYDAVFVNTSIHPLAQSPDCINAYHLYVVRHSKRNEAIARLHAHGIGSNVHYIPVYLHPYYQSLGYKLGICPVAESAYEEIMTLPLWVGLTQKNVRFIGEKLRLQ